MSFAVSKLAMALILPPAGLIILFALGLLLMRKYRRAGVSTLWLSLALLYALSTQPVANGLMNRLEREYRPFTPSGKRPDAVVVLAGGVRDISWTGLKQAPEDASLSRTVAAVALYRAYGGVPLVFAGGSGDPARPDSSEAQAMADAAVTLGVAKDRILVESASRNTLESAREVAGILRKRRIVLVTSAFHMHRSARMFEKQGFTVIAAPAVYLSERRPVTAWAFIPRAGCLSLSATALQEQLSRTWYALIGKI